MTSLPHSGCFRCSSFRFFCFYMRKEKNGTEYSTNFQIIVLNRNVRSISEKFETRLFVPKNVIQFVKDGNLMLGTLLDIKYGIQNNNVDIVIQLI